MSNVIELPLECVVYRTDLYPRFQPNPQKIQEYATNLDVLPAIEVSDTYILIDGYHRWKAHETVGAETIKAIVTPVASEMQLLQLAVQRNATHGLQLSQDDKKRYAIQWWKVLTDEEVCRTLSISDRTFREWTRDKRKQQEEETRQAIYDLWLACRTHEEISKAVNLDRTTVTKQIAEFVKNGGSAENHFSGNFEPQLYSIWNFHKATNEVRHFGNIPPEIIDNLLYYYTQPFDVVFDPFGGGGGTIDKCKERQRRYYVSDLTPIPAREHDMREHDITIGLPSDLPVPDLVFLDPPYWKQAEGKYSDKPNDLANMPLEAFLDTIGSIAKAVKRKWTDRPNARLALIIGAYKHDGAYVDLPFLCYETLKKYLRPIQRIQVPYSTQVHGGAYVARAKEAKEILYLSRDLMIFGV